MISTPSPASAGPRRIPTSLNQAGRLALMHGPDHWVKPPAVFGLRIRGRIDVTLLQETLTAITRRHTALRSFFPPGCSPDWALCLDPADISWEITVTDLSGLAGAARDAAERTALAALQACFTPAVPPLFRSTLIRYGPDDWLLGIAIDHIIFDGASFTVFLRELEMIYAQVGQGHDVAALSVPASDFAVFSAAERAWLRSPDAERSRTYWRALWDGAGPFPRTGLPTRAQDGGQPAGRIWRATLPAADVAATQRRFPGGHLSLFALAASAVLSVQGRLTGRADCALLHAGARRSTTQTAQMIGYLTNRVLLRVPVAATAGLYEVAATARAAILDSIEHEMMPFEHLIEVLSPEYAGRKPRAPYVFLNVDSAPLPPRLGAADVQITSPMTGDALRDVPWLSVDLDQDAAGVMTLSCGYQATLFPSGFIDEFMTRVAGVLASPPGRPGGQVAAEAGAGRRAAHPRVPARTAARAGHQLPARPGSHR